MFLLDPLEERPFPFRHLEAVSIPWLVASFLHPQSQQRGIPPTILVTSLSFPPFRTFGITGSTQVIWISNPPQDPSLIHTCKVPSVMEGDRSQGLACGHPCGMASSYNILKGQLCLPGDMLDSLPMHYMHAGDTRAHMPGRPPALPLHNACLWHKTPDAAVPFAYAQAVASSCHETDVCTDVLMLTYTCAHTCSTVQAHESNTHKHSPAQAQPRRHQLFLPLSRPSCPHTPGRQSGVCGTPTACSQHLPPLSCLGSHHLPIAAP